MADAVPLPKKRLKSLDEFGPPTSRATGTTKRQIMFGPLLCLALVAGVAGGLMLG